MPRRLPLLGTAMKETPLASALRAPLGTGSIGIADTSTGELAVRFGSDLAIAFVRLGVSVRLTVLGYQGEPVLDERLAAELSVHGITPVMRAVAGDGSLVDTPWLTSARVDSSLATERVPDATRSEPVQVGLFVGLPALGACRPALAAVLGADRPLHAWPEVLRGVRGELALSLAATRVGLAPLLAIALIEGGFLPRG